MCHHQCCIRVGTVYSLLTARSVISSVLTTMVCPICLALTLTAVGAVTSCMVPRQVEGQNKSCFHHDPAYRPSNNGGQIEPQQCMESMQAGEGHVRIFLLTVSHSKRQIFYKVFSLGMHICQVQHTLHQDDGQWEESDSISPSIKHYEGGQGRWNQITLLVRSRRRKSSGIERQSSEVYLSAT